MGYPPGLYADDYCHMEGHIYPDATSADPAARAAVGSVKPSVCSRCGEINYSLRAYLASQTRSAKRQTEKPLVAEELSAGLTDLCTIPDSTKRSENQHLAKHDE